MWAEVLLAVIGIGVTLGLVYIANINLWPPALAERYADENGLATAPAISVGIPWPP